jgi:undecaprenyl-diphosphatase
MSFFSGVNQWLFSAIHDFSGHNAFADGVAIFFAVYLPYLLVIGFFVLLYSEESRRQRSYVFAEGVLAVLLARGIVTTIIKFFYNHARPFNWYGFVPLISESGNSFPSGHATWFFALAMVVWWVNRKWGVWYFALATLMAIARVYTGVHWPFDVVGGAAIGILSAIIIRMLLKSPRGRLLEEATSARS